MDRSRDRRASFIAEVKGRFISYAYRSNTPNYTISADAVKIQGRGVSNTAPTTGQVLKWNGSQWVPASDSTVSHTHIGETWMTTTGTVGLVKKLNVNQSSSLYGTVDSVFNSGNGFVTAGEFYSASSGSGSVYGGFFMPVDREGVQNTLCIAMLMDLQVPQVMPQGCLVVVFIMVRVMLSVGLSLQGEVE